MSHPAIPPNCEDFFSNVGGRWRFNSQAIGHEEGDYLYFFIDDDFVPGKLIASVARCGWLDEATRIEKLNPPEDSRPEFAHTDVISALHHTEEWREWGLKHA